MEVNSAARAATTRRARLAAGPHDVPIADIGWSFWLIALGLMLPALS